MQTNTLEKVKRTDLFSIPPSMIIIVNENVRDSYPDEKFQLLKDSIKENGVLEPIHVRKTGDKYALTHGFNRMRAVWELVQEGFEIAFVKAIVSKVSEEEELIQHITLNSGEPLTHYEISKILIKLKNFGWKNRDIAKKLGYSEQLVSNLITFQEGASMEVKNAVSSGELKINTATELVRKSGSVTEQNEKISKARESSSSNGEKKRIVAKDLFEESMSLRERIEKVFELAEEQGVEDERIDFCKELIKLVSQKKNTPEAILTKIL